MTNKLVHQTYGKHRVRVSKIKRRVDSNDSSEFHELMEASVDIELEGGFEDAYVNADNSMVIATDTCRNAVYVLAKDDPFDSIESFGLTVANHFLDRYPHVDRVTVRLVQHQWHRLLTCPHGFLGSDTEMPTAVVLASRQSGGHPVVNAGLEGLMIAKTTQSGFANFHQDEFRTLADTDDRILATVLRASWIYGTVDTDFTACRSTIRSALLSTFINHYSRSVQQTLYRMASAALAAYEGINSITLTMPNKHHIAFNLEPFGKCNDNDVFAVTDEPFGYISATVGR